MEIDKIKEILDRIETASDIFDCLLKPEECTELLDYITNLQQENERLKIEWVLVKSALDTSQSRIEKVIEYIENPRHEMSVLTYQNLLSILQGVGN